MRRITILTLLALTACGSSGPKGGNVGAAPATLNGFPSTIDSRGLFAKAALPADRDFLSALLKKNVVPVHLKISLSDRADEMSATLSSESAGLALYLPDGAALSSVSAEEVAKLVRRRQQDEVLASRLREDRVTDQGMEGFVYFAVQPEDAFRLKGLEITHERGGQVKTMNLTGSLVGFNIVADRGLGPTTVPLYVGIEN